MIDLRESSPLDMLRQFAVSLDADLIENYGASKLILDNDKGKGTIQLYGLFPGLTAWVYDVEFTSDLELDLEFSDQRPYYFGYHISGYQYQKFQSESEFKKVEQGQNFILISEPGTNSEFKIPGNIKYQCCYLILSLFDLKNSNVNTKRYLELNLEEIFDLNTTERPYRYFGNIDVRTGAFAKIVIENKRTDLVGRLLTEGAILNMLASQIEAHDYDENENSFLPNLQKAELSKLTKLGDFIKANVHKKILVKEVSQHLGMNSKKVQSGIRFLYGYSLGQFISNIRLDTAMELLNTTDKSISEICYSVGYNSRSFFSKLFFERYGKTPSDYKKRFVSGDLLYEVSYRSMANTDTTDADIKAIIKTARAHNKSLNITGSLIYHRKVFFQLIEGSKKDILELYESIKKDDRHFDVTTIWEGPKPFREFEDWSMALVTDDGVSSLKRQGSTKNLKLENMMGNIDEESLVSKSLWNKVRNIIKITG